MIIKSITTLEIAMKQVISDLFVAISPPINDFKDIAQVEYDTVGKLMTFYRQPMKKDDFMQVQYLYCLTAQEIISGLLGPFVPGILVTDIKSASIQGQTLVILLETKVVK